MSTGKETTRTTSANVPPVDLACASGPANKVVEHEVTLGSTPTPVYGDMKGDSIKISDHHIKMAQKLLPYVKKLVSGEGKYVIAVSGPSGTGKSETASLLAGMLKAEGTGVYVLSGDNYPFLPPRTNEKHREDIYAKDGDAGLQAYLGTQNEIDFTRIETLISDFKAGKSTLALRIMDNPGNKVDQDPKTLDVSNTKVLFVEWTWGSALKNPDLKIFLYSTPEETKAHRIARGRDPNLDSPVVKTIIQIEQGKLEEIAATKADIVMNRNYEITAKRGNATNL